MWQLLSNRVVTVRIFEPFNLKWGGSLQSHLGCEQPVFSTETANEIRELVKIASCEEGDMRRAAFFECGNLPFFHWLCFKRIWLMKCCCFFHRKNDNYILYYLRYKCPLGWNAMLITRGFERRNGVLKCTNVGNESNDVTVFMMVTL